MNSTSYVGRFAPSPTGHLHFGSLLAAMASYADARSQNGSWLLRIDDIDPPRAMRGANEQIPKTLTQFGFKWDGETLLQSTRTPAYKRALDQLDDVSSLYLCKCSRRELNGYKVYPGHCTPALDTPQSQLTNTARVQHKLSASDASNAIRVTLSSTVAFQDAIQGAQQFTAGTEYGDTVVVRRDALFSYALCCAVDDSDGVTHVVRGFDLLPTTASQVSIMKLLKKPMPQYAHIPIAVNDDQQKLSKQTHAQAIDELPVLLTLIKAWDFLGQDTIQATSVEAFWQQAISKWQLANVPKVGVVHAPD